MTALDLIRRDYRARLEARNIPIRSDRRTPEQQAAAALEFWAARSQVVLDAGSLDRTAVED